VAGFVLAVTGALLFQGCVRTSVEMRGFVEGFDSDLTRVFVHHEAVEGYMPEMTMAFRADSTRLAALSVGDAIAFVLHARGDGSSISDIRRIPASAVALTRAMPDPAVSDSPRGDILAVGRTYPDARLVDQSGDELVMPPGGKDATVVDYIYTRCPLPDYCPALSARFRRLQRLLGERDVMLVSVTLDPEYDTPEVLSAYADRYDADPSRWKMATGSQETIDDLLLASGVNVYLESGTVNHNLATLLLDADGTVARIWRDTGGSAEDILAEVDLIIGKPAAGQQ